MLFFKRQKHDFYKLLRDQAERLHAIVVPDMAALAEKKIVNTRELVRFEIEGLSVSLPAHKRVLGFEISLEPLPRTTTGKLKRFAIQRAWEPRIAGEAPVAAPVDLAVEQAWTADPHVAAAIGIVRAYAKPGSMVRADANLELDLGLDSMERVELLAALEKAFGVRVAEEAAHNIFTVRQLVDVVRPGAAGQVRAADEEPGWASLLAEMPRADGALRRLLEPKRFATPFLFAVIRTLAWLLARPRVTGLEHLETEGPYIISPNHQSYLDPFILCGMLPYRVIRKMFFVGAAEYFESPFQRWLAGLMNIVPVDPDSNLLPAMQAGAFGLKHGRILMLFPEGERSIDGTVKKFKKGAAILAHHLGVPIVPVAIHGVYEIWPRRQPLNWRLLLPWTRKTARIAIGAPIVPAAAVGAAAGGSGAYVTTTDRLRDAVQQMWDRLHQDAAGAR